jgi:hypothetical protein
VVTSNVIGLHAVPGGSDSLQNFGAGVRVTANAIGNFIGVDSKGQISGNVIVNNGLFGSSQSSDGYGGVSIESGTRNRISGNIIYANFGLAIDLGNDCPTPNDGTDSDTGANDLQNSPTSLPFVTTMANGGSAAAFILPPTRRSKFSPHQLATIAAESMLMQRSARMPHH